MALIHQNYITIETTSGLKLYYPIHPIRKLILIPTM